MRDHSRHYREHNGQGTMEVKNRTVSMAAILETGSDCPPKFFPPKSCFYISPSGEKKTLAPACFEYIIVSSALGEKERDEGN